MLLRCTCFAALAVLSMFQQTSAALAPNELIGTCLDEAWVKDVEAKLSISSTELDARGRHVHPHLHAALATQRFRIEDPRTNKDMSELYQDGCKPSAAKFYGVGAKLDTNGNIIDAGNANGSLVVELKGWASILLTTMVFSIIAQEVFGYQVSFYKSPETGSMAQRMSSVGIGVCTPVHVNMESWVTQSVLERYAIYSNESFSSGSVGYAGRSGLFTTKAFIKKGLVPTATDPGFSADFWRDYTRSERLIESLPVSALKANAKYYPPSEVTCADGSIGCLDSCSKSEACTLREAKGGECMVVVLMYDYYDRGYMQAALSNNHVPAYFCFLGYDGMQNYAIEATTTDKPVVFYHYEPDPLHFEYEGLFERITLPRSTPEEAVLDTSDFGENGYGKATSNPVKVDFPTTSLEKYAASLVQEHPLIGGLISRMSISELQVNALMRSFVATTKLARPPADPVFSTACTWLRNNYRFWSLWLDRLPVCSIYYHVEYDFVGCSTADAAANMFPRQVVYRWILPHPDDSALPYNCDGGLTALPAPLVTSRSCAWLKTNQLIWIFWSDATRPACDATFYTYSVSACDRAGSKREVVYRWLLEDATNASLSAECALGDALPPPVLLDCEYVPRTYGGFVVVTVIASVVGAALVLAMGFVFYYRDLPIVKRSQYQFLLLLLAGGVIICVAVCCYAGAPTPGLCTMRPTGLSFGFTLIFGSLVVKSLRVYRVFMSGAMKRVVLSATTMYKILGLFVVIDSVILGAWNIVDPSTPVHVSEATAAIGGNHVERLRCTSTGFIFTALLIFWKAVLLFAGLYLSFLIRNVSSDFQESVWIFASALVVLFTSLILLPMAYLVELPATTFYLFFSLLLLSATATVMGLMIAPKILRLHTNAVDNTSTTNGTNRSHSSSDTTKGNQRGAAGLGHHQPDKMRKQSERSAHDVTTPMASLVPSAKKTKSKVQVTPVKKFTTEK